MARPKSKNYTILRRFDGCLMHLSYVPAMNKFRATRKPAAVLEMKGL